MKQIPKLYEVYTLKKAFVPEIKNGKIIKGEKYGGVLLIYKKRLATIYIFRIFNRNIRFIRYISKAKTVAFLKPFKKFWDVKSHRLPPNYWNGKKSKKPLTNIWCKLNRADYQDFSIGIKTNIYYVKKYLNHETRKTLDQMQKKIIIEKSKL